MVLRGGAEAGEAGSGSCVVSHDVEVVCEIDVRCVSQPICSSSQDAEMEACCTSQDVDMRCSSSEMHVRYASRDMDAICASQGLEFDERRSLSSKPNPWEAAQGSQPEMDPNPSTPNNATRLSRNIDFRRHTSVDLDVKCFAHEVDVRCVRHEIDVRCVVVGDDAVGKTSMLMGYATNRYPTQHVPSVFDNYAGTVKVAGRMLHLEIIDTLQEIGSPSVRLSEYPGTDIFVVCFSVVRPETLRHVEDTWLPEIRAHAPETPFILVGTQADLREVDQICAMLRERGQDPISWSHGSAAARRIGAACYIECSPGVEKKLRKIINSAIASVLKVRDPTLAAQATKCAIL